MKKQILPRTPSILIGLLLAVLFSQVGCSSELDPVTTLSQVVKRWHKQRTESGLSLIPMEQMVVKENDPVSHALVGQRLMVQGDMKSALEFVHKAIAINPDIDVPHELLADLIYRLALFDLVDRRLCKITVTPLKDIPVNQLYHGHLNIEIPELIRSGRPAIYRELLSSYGIDERKRIKILIYMYSLMQDVFAGLPDSKKTLEELGGPPKALPILDCQPDEQSRSLLRLAYDEILLAQQADTIETPGLLLIPKERTANLTVRLQILLGEDLIPIEQDSPAPVGKMQHLPAVLPSALTQDLELPRIINEICDYYDTLQTENFRKLDLSSDLRKLFEDALSKDPTNLMARLNLAYSYKQAFQFRKALEQYVIASNQAPEIADAFIGLGRIYYDLAIVDMTNRRRYSMSQHQLPVFHPDERTKKILQLAKETLLTSKRLRRLMQEGENGVKTYLSPPGTEDQFLKMIEYHLNNN